MYMWAIEMQLSELANNLGENEVTKFGIKHILDNGIWDSLMIQNWSLDREGININTEKGEETKKHINTEKKELKLWHRILFQRKEQREPNTKN